MANPELSTPKKVVPVLITCDVDPAYEISHQNRKHSIDLALELFEQFQIKSTFFFVAEPAESYRREIHDLISRNHEIACHGLIHDYKEDYSILPEDVQRENLTLATKKLENLTGHPIKSFRGPQVKTSHLTHKILEDLNYSADSSVCSQRIDLISSNLINTGWILAPRLPYHPSKSSAFRRGERKILVVPVSSLLFPFISGTLYLFGPSFMKQFFNVLYLESRRTGKPIVYLMHPTEFVEKTQKDTYKPSLRKVRSGGFYFRKRLKNIIDEKKR
ncbi:MAG: polysaccharide deacetylase family protein, partial [Candidatus Hodarchaeota archaeon]